ncbi:MAG: hypothetical protein AAGH79_18695, partial [Bacteroidota bacterium]
TNAIDALYLFVNSFGNGRTERRRIPTMKGRENKIESDDPKLEFLLTDSLLYFKKEDFEVYFKHLDAYPLKSIYIVSHSDGHLLFHAGDRAILRRHFDLPTDVSPSVEEMLDIERIIGDTETTYELNWEGFKDHLLGELKAGQYYQLGIELAEDSSDHNPYLFNFRILTEEELKELILLFERE